MFSTYRYYNIVCIHCVAKMKNKQLRLRLSDRRFTKLQKYAIYADKTMTQVIEELLDSLPSAEIGDSDAGVPANASLSSTPCPVNPAD